MKTNPQVIAKAVIAQARQSVQCPAHLEYAVIFIGDKEMRELNLKYRGKDKTTNVLAFESGDIFISLAEAKREAKKYDWTLRYEIARLALHGFLHLLGYDHEEDKEAEKMERIEEKILKSYV